MTATCWPAALSMLATRMPNEPSPTTTMWRRRWRIFCRLVAWEMRWESRTSATNATRIAIVATPASIIITPQSRSQVGWSEKLKSP